MENTLPKRLTPEELDIASAYLSLGSAEAVASEFSLPISRVSEILSRPDAQNFINQIYLDQGYRNRHKLGSLLDKMIESKLIEAEESGMYTTKDLYDLISLAHKITMDNAKLNQSQQPPSQTNIQVNNNYGSLMEKLTLGTGSKGSIS